MKTVKNLTASLVIAGSLLGGVGMTQAAERNDASAVVSAPVSLEQAVAAALTQVPGKASLAEFETDDATGKAFWKVEVVTGKNVIDVEVDASNGAILKQAVDKADSDEDDEEDEKGKEEREDKDD